jgi:16S rRNA (cytidine1402-2'-O)-methyltransferase
MAKKNPSKTISKNGTLYIVPTPIGNLEDLSPRAVSTLSSVDAWIVEDSRHSGILQQHLTLKKPMIPLHRFNEQAKNTSLINKLISGKHLALISDAGTPLIHDPGRLLVDSAHKKSIPIIPLPGPCALTTALSASGMPSDTFVFEGFLPEKATQRQSKLRTLSEETRTLVFYEAPHRLLKTLNDLCTIFEPTRRILLAKELSKKYETLIRCELNALLSTLKSGAYPIKGEWVLVLEGKSSKTQTADEQAIQHCLNLLIPRVGMKEAISLTVDLCHCKKNTVYRLALKTKKNNP